MKELIEALCQLPGTSGCEGPVREEILRRLGACPDILSIETDPLGNLIVEKKGQRAPKNKVMLSAHMDEVGLVVTAMEENGRLRVEAVGGIDTRVLTGKPFLVGPDQIYGILGTKATHQQTAEERKKPPKLEELTLDIGAASAQEAQKRVSLGDRAVFASSPRQLGEHLLCAKALDDRAGCAVLLCLLEEDLPCDCTVVFTVNEETGVMGAGPASFTVGADIALVVEATTASDLAGVPREKQVCRLGEGPALSFMDLRTVYDQALYQKVMALGQQKGIPCQPKSGVCGGNESGSVQGAGRGRRTLAVSMPCRYIHSPACVIDLRDCQSTLQLLRAVLSEVDGL